MFDGLLARVQTEYNDVVTDYNDACDEIERLQKVVEILEEKGNGLLAEVARQARLMERQREVIDAAVEVKKRDQRELTIATAQLRDLQAMNPQRLNKQIKNLQEKNAQLQKDNTTLKKQTAEAIKSLHEMTKKVKDKNLVPFYVDGENGNVVKFLTGVFMSADNQLNAVPHAPVVEFYHSERGITRQGFLSTDGDLHWCSPEDSEPDEIENSVALKAILDYCNKFKINTKGKPKPKMVAA